MSCSTHTKKRYSSDRIELFICDVVKNNPMQPLQSLFTAARTVRSNPILLLVAFAFIAVGEAMVAVQMVSTVLYFVVILGWIAFFPFLLAGFIGIAAEGLSGPTTLSTFLREGRSNYVSMFGATILLTLIFGALGVAWVLISIIGGVGAIAAGGTAGTAVGITVVVFAGLVILGIPWMFLQFYAVAIVVDDIGMGSSLAHSMTVAKEKILAVAGFTILFFVVSGVGQAPGFALYFMSIETTTAGETLITDYTMYGASVAITLVLGTITTALAYTYLVAFYTALTDDEQSGGQSPLVTDTDTGYDNEWTA